jgi:peptide-methionine (S)-S-oxide reductase
MSDDGQNSDNRTTKLATLANGCFWCTEAVFRRLRGVISATPGYSGGLLPNPTYEQVTTGSTGHAESIQVEFNPAEISYEKLLEVFWATHDPTTLNRQGADVGTQYRSAIFYHDEDQRTAAEKSKTELAQHGKYQDPIVTEITEYTNFYPADERHKDYYERNRSNGYCRVVIDPKIQKLYKDFKPMLKDPGI